MIHYPHLMTELPLPEMEHFNYDAEYFCTLFTDGFKKIVPGFYNLKLFIDQKQVRLVVISIDPEVFFFTGIFVAAYYDTVNFPDKLFTQNRHN